MAFQQKVEPIKKDATNPHFRNKYATLTNILGEIKPIMNEVGLLITQPIFEGQVQTVITDPESGETMSSCITLPEGLSPQAMGSAITYFRRYTLAAILSLEIEDDDGNAATPAAPTNGQQATAPGDEKPWMTDKQVQQAVEKIKTGEAGIVDKCKLNYRISKVNMEKLTKALEGK